MSLYEPQSDASPYYWVHNKSHSYKVQVRRAPVIQLATSAQVARRLGGKNPAWVRAVDWSIPKVKWLWKNRYWLKYYMSVPSALINASQKKKYAPTKTDDSVFQEGPQLRTSKSSRSNEYHIQCHDRSRFCRTRTGKRHRRCRCYRVYHKRDRVPVQQHQSRKRSRFYVDKYPTSKKRTNRYKSKSRRWKSY